MSAEGLTLEAVELYRILLPLVSPFETSFGVQTKRDILVIKAITSAGEGWGECVATEFPTYSPEYIEGAQHVLVNHLLPRLFDRPLISAADVAVHLAPVHGHQMAKSCIEMAILDAELRARGESFAQYIGAVRGAVDSGVSVGIQKSVPELLAVVGDYIDQGYRRIKLKIKPGWDYEPVRAVREKFSDIPLQVDANTAYTLGDARRLAMLDPFNLLLIEQPLPEDEVRAHAELAKLVKTPICLDESIHSARAAADAIRIGACAIINIKPGRAGGYLEGRRIHDVCAANGIPVWMGGMLETGLGRAGNVAMAAMPNFTLPGDTSASDRFYRQDIITEPFVLQEGRLAVRRGPGFGVTIDQAVLKEVTTFTDTVRPEGRTARAGVS